MKYEIIKTPSKTCPRCEVKKSQKMKCKKCGIILKIPRDLANIQNGNRECIFCWYQDEHGYY